MKFIVKFYDYDGLLTDACKFSVWGDESLFDRLEETLYIVQEITPLYPRNWWKELSDHYMTYFTYRGQVKIRVSFDPSENLFICEDIE